jgi:DNA replication protein DnaC
MNDELVQEYFTDDAFSTWYANVTGNSLTEDAKDIHEAHRCYEQEKFCSEHCEPTWDERLVLLSINDKNYDISRQFRCNDSREFRSQGYYINDGKILKYTDGVFVETRCEHFVNFHRHIQILRAKIPKLFFDASFDNFIPQNDSQKNALNICSEYVSEFGDTGLYICGPVGVGKTHLAVATIKSVLFGHDRIKGLFMRTSHLLQQLRPPVEDAQLLDKVSTIPILVLDDMGVQKDSEWTYEQITAIIDTRLVDMLPTIITSNLTLESLAKDNLECERIVSRIKQMCDCVLIKGNDYRDKMARDRRKA